MLLSTDPPPEKLELLSSKKAVRTCVVVGLILLFAAAVTLLFVLFAPNFGRSPEYYQDYFTYFIDSDAIKAESIAISSEPHLAGTPQDYQTAVYVRDKWLSYGLNARIEQMSVLLTYPLSRSVSASFPNGDIFNCSLTEAVVGDGTSNNPNIVPTWNGWSGSGKASGELVYANYGRKEDFEAIADVNLTGKIVIVRYGQIFRGDKVYLAVARGAIGVLIYSDPGDTGFEKGSPYPTGPWGSNTSVQRGALWTGNGDPQTPGLGWPSLDAAPRLTIDEAKAQNGTPWDPLPNIPVQPISSQDAEPLLKALGGNPIPSPDWQGGFQLSNMGPGPVIVHIEVQAEYKTTPIWNVIGIITGDEEPNRLVVVGCHRDAWVFGTADPISGHSPMMEMARTFGLLLEKGWSPRRTMVFTSWDAEEFGLIGSSEFAERWSTVLSNQAVAYLNLDNAAQGISNFQITGTPSLTKLFSDVAAQVQLDSGTVYDAWQSKKFGLLGAGSDQAAFAQHLGIPSVYMGFDSPAYQGVYHSAYDSLFWMNNFGDPSYAGHKAVTELYGLLAMSLLDYPILPFDYTAYAQMLQEAVNSYTAITGSSVDWSGLNQAIIRLTEASRFIANEAKGFQTFVPNAMRCQGLAYRLQNLNNRLMLAERIFLGDKTLSGHEWYRNIVNAPSRTNRYGGSALPAIGDAVTAQDWEQTQFLSQRFAIIINSVADFLTQEFYKL